MTWLALLAFTAFFMLLHVVVRWRSDRPFNVDLRLSRGAGAVCLAAVGFASIAAWWPLWDRAFLARATPGSAGIYLVFFVIGHLVADMLWIGGGLYFAVRPRPDLVVHHVLGLVVSALVLWLEVAYELVGVVLSSEIMPTVSGLLGWAQVVGRDRLVRRAQKLRFAVLVGWRLPLWAVLISILTFRLVTGTAEAGLVGVHYLAIGAFLCVVALDVYWTRQVVAGLERLSRSARRCRG